MCLFVEDVGLVGCHSYGYLPLFFKSDEQHNMSPP